MSNQSEASTAEETKSKDSSTMGPLPPKEDDFDQTEIAKAEEHKTAGNKFFKGK
jgi:hypothetical protein